MTACGFIFFKCAPTGVEGRRLNCAPVWLELGCCERDVAAHVVVWGQLVRVALVADGETDIQNGMRRR